MPDCHLLYYKTLFSYAYFDDVLRQINVYAFSGRDPMKLHAACDYHGGV